jgi:hypothetical protein
VSRIIRLAGGPGSGTTAFLLFGANPVFDLLLLSCYRIDSGHSACCSPCKSGTMRTSLVTFVSTCCWTRTSALNPGRA